MKILLGKREYLYDIAHISQYFCSTIPQIYDTQIVSYDARH
jgi:hypothetical protein